MWIRDYHGNTKWVESQQRGRHCKRKRKIPKWKQITFLLFIVSAVSTTSLVIYTIIHLDSSPKQVQIDHYIFNAKEGNLQKRNNAHYFRSILDLNTSVTSSDEDKIYNFLRKRLGRFDDLSESKQRLYMISGLNTDNSENALKNSEFEQLKETRQNYYNTQHKYGHDLPNKGKGSLKINWKEHPFFKSQASANQHSFVSENNEFDGYAIDVQDHGYAIGVSDDLSNEETKANNAESEFDENNKNDMKYVTTGTYGSKSKNSKNSKNTWDMDSILIEKHYLEQLLTEYTHLDRFTDDDIRPDRKVILLFTTMFKEQEWTGLPAQGLKDITSKYKCKVQNCDVTYNRQLFNRSDVVLFHMPDAKQSYDVTTLNKHGGRPLHQQWVFFTSESPESPNTPFLSHYDGLFNLTMTYHTQSDIPIPYGKYEMHNEYQAQSSTLKNKISNYISKIRKGFVGKQNYAAGRTNSASWFVSNCNSLSRIKLVNKIKKLYKLYVGGDCAVYYNNQIDCEDDGTGSINDANECSNAIKQHKYYLSFENAFCDDYVTEKYWRNAIGNNVIPIVLGGANYSKVAIPNSFIDAQQFESVEALVEYLKFLDSNDEEYNSYFNWKDKFKMVPRTWPYSEQWLCDLCEIVNNKKFPTKIYADISQWWSQGTQCSEKNSAKIKTMLDFDKDDSSYE